MNDPWWATDKALYLVWLPCSLISGAFGVAWWGRILGWW